VLPCTCIERDYEHGTSLHCLWMVVWMQTIISTTRILNILSLKPWACMYQSNYKWTCLKTLLWIVWVWGDSFSLCPGFEHRRVFEMKIDNKRSKPNGLHIL